MHAFLGLTLLFAQPKEKQIDVPAGAIARLGSQQFRHSSHTSLAALSPDGKLLATVSSSEGMRLWDVATGQQLLFHPRLTKGYFGGVVFSPDGKLLASRRENGITLIDVAKRETRLELPDEKSGYQSPFFSADGKLLAAASGNARIRIWDTTTGKLTDKRDDDLQFKEAAAGKLLRKLKLKDEFFLVTMLRLSPDDKLLAIGEGPHHQNGEVKTPMYFRMHDAGTGTERYRIPMKWEEGFVSAFAFAPDGKTMVMALRPMSTTFENRLEMRDVATGKLQKTVPLPHYNYNSLSFSGDGKMLAVAGEEYAARLFTYPDFKPHLPPTGHMKYVTSLAFSADGWKAFSTGEDSRLIAWDLKTKEPANTWPIPCHFGNDPKNAHDLIATPDGRHLLAVVWRTRDNPFSKRKDPRYIEARTGSIHFMQLPDGKKIREMPVTGAAALSPDGKLMAVGDGTGVRLLEVATGETLRTLTGPKMDVLRLAFSSNGAMITSTDGEGQVHVWRVATGEIASRLRLTPEDDRRYFGSDAPVVTFAPDSRYLIAAHSSWSTTIDVWELASSERVQLIRMNKKRMPALSLLAHGRTLLVFDMSSPPHLFDLSTGKSLANPFEKPMTSVARSADGKTLITAGTDGFLLTWNADRLNAPPVEAAKLSDADLRRRWENLNGPANAAFAAQWELAAGGEAAVEFISKRIKPVAGPAPDMIAKRIEELGSENFKIRDRAHLNLEQWGLAVEFDVRAALAKKAPLETKRRLEELAAKLDRLPVPEDWLRWRRAIATLEAIGGDGARATLTTMGGGASGAVVTVEAKASLNRIRP